MVEGREGYDEVDDHTREDVHRNNDRKKHKRLEHPPAVRCGGEGGSVRRPQTHFIPMQTHKPL